MIASDLLSPVLSRWEINPPAIFGGEAHGELRNVFGVLLEHSIVRQTAGASAVDCTECGRRCRVQYIADTSGKMQGFICCSDCGIAKVSPQSTERWKIDSRAFLGVTFAGVTVSLRERVVGQLWQVGKTTWAGRSREVWFVRAFRRGRISDALKALAGRPKAILFAPTETGAERWRDATENLVIALESTLSVVDGAIVFDVGYVESRIIDAGLGVDSTAKRRSKKRADRAANIELLKKEMCEHLRAARDHAYAGKEQTGEPELLPRPTQKALGERVGLSESDVSRCLRDSQARELQLYWEAALDLSQIMTWKGPIAKGPKA